MKSRKLLVAIAAILLGAQLGSPLAAAVGEEQLATVEQLMANGQIDELLAYLQLYPELLALNGALGDALRAFMENPSSEALAAIANTTPSGVTVAAMNSGLGNSSSSIY